MGAAALAQLSSAELFAVATEAHAQLGKSMEPGRHIFKSLDPRQNETVIVVSELIIPETDTPGAKAARVNEFVDVMLTDWFTDEERMNFLRGLVALDRDDRRFVDLDEADQIAVLENLEVDSFEEKRRRERTGGPVASTESPADQPFFSVMKWLTLYGYYTSKVGMEQELHHEIFPGAYEGCAPIRNFEV